MTDENETPEDLPQDQSPTGEAGQDEAAEPLGQDEDYAEIYADEDDGVDEGEDAGEDAGEDEDGGAGDDAAAPAAAAAPKSSGGERIAKVMAGARRSG